MDDKLNRQLYEKYQDMCDRSVNSEIHSPFALDGFSACPNGWYRIIDEYMAVLNQFPGISLLQVKAKFGSLRVYFHGNVSSKAQEILDTLETSSRNICDECGKPGTTRSSNYWSRTVCDEHYAQWQAEANRRKL